MIGAPVTFVVVTAPVTFNDIVENNSYVPVAPPGLRQVRAERTSTTTTEKKDTDGTGEDNLTQLGEDVTLVPPFHQALADEHPCDWAEAIEEQETQKDEGKVPTSSLGSAAAGDPCVPLSRSLDSAKKTLKRVYNAASNCVQVVWTIPEKKLSIKDKSFTSPDFAIWEGGSFKLVLRAYPDNVKGGFHGSRGVGRMELKFCAGTEFAGKIHWRVAVGQNKELPSEGLDHDFTTRPQSILQQEWNFLSAVSRGSLLLHLEARMETSHGCRL